MPAPVIGITTSRATNKMSFPILYIGEAYTQALIRADACPVLIPSGLPETALHALVSRLDGILFSGGGDVEPERYGSRPHPLVSDMDRDRDRVEIQLIRDSIQSGLPFLGICRGLQVINVALGGSLYEDILDQHPQAVRHQYASEYPRDYLAHPVTLAGTSRLSRILGTTSTQVNSLHHQGIRDLAPGIMASACSPDGIVEALEVPGHRFGLAVQWHPEWMAADPGMTALFRAFVEAAEG